jgi:YHS domain-containing protein
MTIVSCRKPAVLGTFAAFLALVTFAAGYAVAEGGAKPAAAKPVPYPLSTCLVSGEKLGEDGEPVSLLHEGQEFKFCCKKCITAFNKEPQKYHDMLAKAVIQQQTPGYPLKTCVVSGEELGADAYDHVHQGQLVRFCCKKCLGAFQQDPAKYLAKIEAARKTKKG